MSEASNNAHQWENLFNHDVSSSPAFPTENNNNIKKCVNLKLGYGNKDMWD